MGEIIVLLILALPFVLTAWNIFAFLYYLITKREKRGFRAVEVIAMCVGIFYLRMYTDLSNIVFVNWDVPLYFSQQHSFIAPDAFVTIVVILLVAFAGYLSIRFIPACKQSPIVSAVGISAVYLGIGLFVLLCIQTSGDLFLVLLPANCIIIFVKSIFILVVQKNALLQAGTSSTKYKKLSGILNNATNLPWIALILLIPLLGILVAILFLFGQAPNSIIKAWTETADWTMSQKIRPQDIEYDGHYLCTVAAGGHRKVVKPIRTGMRRGHRVVVNRQLCVANAFEQILEEKVPAFHRAVRKVYDSAGYPIAKHIHSKFVADIIYFLMKPLEWFFLLVLYAVDVTPEDRIATQYPHSALMYE